MVSTISIYKHKFDLTNNRKKQINFYHFLKNLASHIKENNISNLYLIIFTILFQKDHKNSYLHNIFEFIIKEWSCFNYLMDS